MPSKVHQAVARQWELLKLLPSRRPGKTVRELVVDLADKGYKVSKRTVERDLGELASLFPIRCNDQGIPYGWHWVPEAHFDLPGLTLAEAMSTRLLEEYLKPLLPLSILRTLAPRFQHAAAKLAAQGNNPLSGWSDKVRVVSAGLNLLPPKIDQQVLETMQEALLADEKLEITYQAAHREEASSLTIHPLGLVQKGPVTYLVATAFDYEDPRLYALHRINSANRTGEKCRRPAGFALDAYIETGALQFGAGDYINLKASITADLAKILRETPLSEEMEIEERADDCLLTCTIAATWQLRWWILSQGEQIEVLGPMELRESIVNSIRGTARIYSFKSNIFFLP